MLSGGETEGVTDRLRVLVSMQRSLGDVGASTMTEETQYEYAGAFPELTKG